MCIILWGEAGLLTVRKFLLLFNGAFQLEFEVLIIVKIGWYLQDHPTSIHKEMAHQMSAIISQVCLMIKQDQWSGREA